MKKILTTLLLLGSIAVCASAQSIEFTSRTGKKIPAEKTSIRYGEPFFAQIVLPGAKPELKEIVLIINGRPFPEYPAKQLTVRDSILVMQFNIDHSGEMNLAKFLSSDRADSVTVKVDIGKKDGTRLTSKSSDLTIKFYKSGQKALVIITAIVLVIGLIFLAVRSNLLKDEIDPNAIQAQVALLIAAGNPNPVVLTHRWSLAKTQLAVWTLTIAILYFLIWIVSESTPATNTTVLALLGISFGTTAAASLKDSDKRARVLSKSNFFLDLIDDGTGASIHRFQNVVFIVVLLCIFIGNTYRALEFPIFNETQLLLLGISSAGYVGMKFLKEG